MLGKEIRRARCIACKTIAGCAASAGVAHTTWVRWEKRGHVSRDLIQRAIQQAPPARIRYGVAGKSGARASAAELRALRREFGLSQDKAARALGVHGDTWASWEGGKGCSYTADQIRLTFQGGFRAGFLSGEEVKSLRLSKGLAAAETAALLKVAIPTYYTWEAQGTSNDLSALQETPTREHPRTSGDTIRGMIKDLAVTQATAARLMGVSLQTLRYWFKHGTSRDLTPLKRGLP